MPYPPQPYPPVVRSAPVGCIATRHIRLPSSGPVEPDNTTSETMSISNADSVPHSSTFVVESAKYDVFAQTGSLAEAQDTPDTPTDHSNWHLVSPNVHGGAYIRSSASLNVTMAPLVLVENGRPDSSLSTLDSPMDIQHENDLIHSGLEVESDCGFDTTPRTVTGSLSQLLCVAAFSHLSCPRYASPPVAPDSVNSQVHHTPPPGKTELSAPGTDGSSDESPNSSLLFTRPASPTFVRPMSPLPPSSPGFTNSYSMECSDDIPIPSFPLLSSPVPSSSPPNFFTSSPTRNALYKSPPTSPAPTEKPAAVFSVVDSNPPKRPRSPDTMTTSTGDQVEGLGVEITKRRRLNIQDPPQPIRSTHLSQHREYAKLKTPFRSPVTTTTKDCPRYKDSCRSSEPDPPSSPTPPAQDSMTVARSSLDESGKNFMTRVRTPRASAQFKSPLSAVAASDTGNRRRVVSASPNVQALQLRLQTLKRAIKIRNDGEGEKLERLVKKWTDVAREVAWEVWSVVKDNVRDVSNLDGRRGALQSNWGWADEDKTGAGADAEKLGGEGEVLSEDDEPTVPEDTMSAMLRKLGVDPGTMGWDEDEGEFMDVSS